MIPNPRLRAGLLAVIGKGLYAEYNSERPETEKFKAHSFVINEGTDDPVLFDVGQETFAAWFEADPVPAVVIGAWDGSTPDSADLTAQALQRIVNGNESDLIILLAGSG